jgi:ribokinase
MPEAVRRANAAGALACLKLGAQPSMPTAAAVDEFFRTRAEA